jgi:hypothetical protein
VKAHLLRPIFPSHPGLRPLAQVMTSQVAGPMSLLGAVPKPGSSLSRTINNFSKDTDRPWVETTNNSGLSINNRVEVTTNLLIMQLTIRDNMLNSKATNRLKDTFDAPSDFSSNNQSAALKHKNFFLFHLDSPLHSSNSWRWIIGAGLCFVNCKSTDHISSHIGPRFCLVRMYCCSSSIDFDLYSSISVTESQI